jgi:glycosyltransferase involved in cell wall biosynthesis
MAIIFSIIIPAYNEEKNLGKLLESIKKQDYKDYEILVSDAGSVDKTTAIAKKYSCRIVKGGLPAKGRNNGAKYAKGDILLFLDSDIILPKYFLKKSFLEFKKRNLDAAGVSLTPISNNLLDIFFHDIYNMYQKLSYRFDPHISGACFFVKKDIFFEVKGFNENLMIAEDHALARKIKSKGYKTGILRLKILVSIRRLEYEGRIKVAVKFLFFWFRRFFGEIENSFIKYDLKNR